MKFGVTLSVVCISYGVSIYVRIVGSFSALLGYFCDIALKNVLVFLASAERSAKADAELPLFGSLATERPGSSSFYLFVSHMLWIAIQNRELGTLHHKRQRLPTRVTVVRKDHGPPLCLVWGVL